MTRVANKPRWAKVRNPIEWICDKCRLCGDPDCCKEKSKEVLHRIVGKNYCLCSDCFKVKHKRGAKPKETGFHMIESESNELQELMEEQLRRQSRAWSSSEETQKLTIAFITKE